MGHRLQLDVLADSAIAVLLSDARSQFFPFIFQDWAKSFPELLDGLLPAVRQLSDGVSTQVAYGPLLGAPPVVAVMPGAASPFGGPSGRSSAMALPGPGLSAVHTPSSGSGLSLVGLAASGPGHTALSLALRLMAPLPCATCVTLPTVSQAGAAAVAPMPTVVAAASSQVALLPPSSQPVASQSTQVVMPPLMDRPLGWSMVRLLCFAFDAFWLIPFS